MAWRREGPDRTEKFFIQSLLRLALPVGRRGMAFLVSADAGSKPALSEFRGLLASTNDAAQSAPREQQSDKTLQQFMQWRQKADSSQ